MQLFNHRYVFSSKITPTREGGGSRFSAVGVVVAKLKLRHNFALRIDNKHMFATHCILFHALTVSTVVLAVCRVVLEKLRAFQQKYARTGDGGAVFFLWFLAHATSACLS